MVPIPKGDELGTGAGAFTNSASVYGTESTATDPDPGIATMITWTHGAGQHVFVEGSWDNWTTR